MQKVRNLIGVFIFWFGASIVLVGMHLINDEKIQATIIDTIKKSFARATKEPTNV